MENPRLESAFRDLELIAEAADKKERCPKTGEFGPLKSHNISVLMKEGYIRSEVYRHNYRVITILKGPHAGKSTAPPEDGGLTPYKVNGELVRGLGRF